MLTLSSNCFQSTLTCCFAEAAVPEAAVPEAAVPEAVLEAPIAEAVGAAADEDDGNAGKN